MMPEDQKGGPPHSAAGRIYEDQRVDRRWHAFLKEMERRGQGDYQFVKTGLESLDELLAGGLPPEQVTLLCGSPGSGKTSFALDIARRHVLRRGKAVFWSLELPDSAVMARLVCMACGVPWAKVLRGGCLEEVEQAGQDLAGCDLYILDGAKPPPDSLLMPYQGRLTLLVVDYVQLLASMGKEQRQAVEQASGQILGLAKRTGATVLAISSTSRASYSLNADAKVKPEDVLAMARDSGRLEFDAAVVLGLLARREVDGDSRFKRGYLMVGKNRFGMLGKVPVQIDGLAGILMEVEESEEVRVGTPQTEEQLENEILRLVSEQNLTTKKEIKDRITTRGKRTGDAITRLLAEGRMVGGGKNNPFKGVERAPEEADK